MSKSGFKPTVWHVVVDGVVGSTVGNGNKDVAQCKTCYQRVRCCCSFSWHLTLVQLKADYKIVKTLRGLLGFGWDNYLKVSLENGNDFPP